MNNMDKNFFYHDEPVFGLDVGFSSVKVMQVDGDNHKRQRVVTGYGTTGVEDALIEDGVIADPENLARSIQHLFRHNLVGRITTRRVAVAVPASRTYTRSMTLPKMRREDIASAVQLETEQYVPVPLDQLYVDYLIIRESDKEIELLTVAVPRKIVDSYLILADLLGLEIVAIESTIGAATRLFIQAERSDVPTVLIDLGSASSDITIYDQALVVTGTVPEGGDNFTELIGKKLGLEHQEAHALKTKYGLGRSKRQQEITDALTPTLDQLVKEIKRMIRYYEERATAKDRKISQVVTMGGGASMPGLSEYLTNALRVPVRMCDPWQHLAFGDLQPPSGTDKSMYVTVAGLAMVNPEGLFR